MKSVLISIQPKWCELIANGTKTVEVRKTKPKLETPFKVYIYCTKKETVYLPRDIFCNHPISGKVIGEFVCNDIECFTTDYRADEEQTDRISVQSCLTWGDLMEYEVNSPCLYAWHISDLVIYDKPKELSEFKHYKKYDWWDYGHHTNKPQWELRSITRPPQSWCYVEKVGEG